MWRRTALAALLVVRFTTEGWCAEGAAAVKFEPDVLPILSARCWKCHGEGKIEAGLDLRRRFLIVKGGDSGGAIDLQRPSESLLLQRIEADEMPPPEEGRLDASQKGVLRKWVEGGAPTVDVTERPLEEGEAVARLSDEDRAFWAFQPPRRPRLPDVASAGSAAGRPADLRNPVDAFLLEKLSARGLSFQPEASKPVLLRRLCFDLHGLPPTLEQLEEFLADDSPDAYERLVDRLLAGPEYGERWGRQWLDIAGYADSDGYLAADRVRPEAWRYRDWIIRALNRDLPYDQFVTEQLAGDELSDWRRGEEITPEVYDQLVATGFLRTALDPTYPGYTEPNEIHQVIADTMQIVGSTFLGLTIQCARCHAHKFDPISQRDYYALQAVFLGGLDAARWQPSEVRGIPWATEAEQARAKERNAKVDERVASLTASLNDLTLRFRRKRVREAWQEQSARRTATAPDGAPVLEPGEMDQLIAALVVPPAKRDSEQKKRVAAHGVEISLAEEELAGRYAEYREEAAKWKSALAAEQALKQNIPLLRGFVDLDDRPPPGRILRRGDFNQPGAEVAPGVVDVLAPDGFRLEPQPGYKTSGRRTALARWLTAGDHPLLARVQVNRIWAGHFGRGLVPTLANFGRSGVPPTHPELLDWLAVEFREGNGGAAYGSHSPVAWSQKKLHRLIVTSAAYRQTAETDERRRQVDPDNRWLGAWSPKRHQAEMVRDSLLAVSGRLNAIPYGKWANVVAPGDGSVVDSDDAPGCRRTIYQIVRRSQHLTMLELFDAPAMEVNCPERPVSTVPLQALAMLHGPAVDRAAGALGDRIWSAAVSDEARIRYAFRLLFTREPADVEVHEIREALSALAREHAGTESSATAAGAESAHRAAWRDVALVLLNSNEFIYVH